MLPFRNDNIDETNSSDGDASSIYYSNNEEAGDGEFLDARSESEWTSSTESSDDGSSVYFSGNEDAFIVQFNEPRMPEIVEVGDDEFVDAHSEPEWTSSTESEWTSSTDTPEIVIATPEIVIATPIDRSKFIAFVLLVFVGGVSIGYGIAIPGGIIAMPEFLVRVLPNIFIAKEKAVEDNFCIYRDALFLLYSYMIVAAGLMTTFFTMPYRRFGRRSLATGASLLIVGSAFMTWCPNLYLDIAGRFITGVGAGLLNQVIPSLSSELLVGAAKTKWSRRFQEFIAFGNTMANLVNLIGSRYHKWGWRMAIGVVGVLGFLVLSLSLFIFESPYILVERGEAEKAKRVLRETRGCSVSSVETEYRGILQTMESERRKNSFLEIWRENRPVLIITTTLTILGTFLGIDVIMFYGPFILQSLHYEKNESYLASFVLSLSNTVSKVIGPHIIRRFGRRMIYPVACVVAATSQIVLFVVFHDIPNPHHHLAYPRDVFAGVLILVSTMAYGLLPGPLDWIDSAYPEDCGTLGSKITTVQDLASTFVNGQVLFSILCGTREHIFLLYAANFMVVLLFILAFLPETRGITQEEMHQRVWTQHWFWKRHVTNRSPPETEMV